MTTPNPTTKYGVPLEHYRKAMWSRCPTCGADEGDRCTDAWGGTKYKPHKARLDRGAARFT